MHELGNSITEVFHKFYQGDIGDDGNSMKAAMAKGKAGSLWASISGYFRKISQHFN